MRKKLKVKSKEFKVVRNLLLNYFFIKVFLLNTEPNRSIPRATFQQRQSVVQRPAAIIQQRQMENGNFDSESISEIVS